MTTPAFTAPAVYYVSNAPTQLSRLFLTCQNFALVRERIVQNLLKLFPGIDKIDISDRDLNTAFIAAMTAFQTRTPEFLCTMNEQIIAQQTGIEWYSIREQLQYYKNAVFNARPRFQPYAANDRKSQTTGGAATATQTTTTQHILLSLPRRHCPPVVYR